MWDILPYQEKYSTALAAQWRDMLEASMRSPSAKRPAAAEIDRIMLNAMENGFQREVIASLSRTPAQQGNPGPSARPSVQAAFCIDVRSEVFRRSLETVSSKVQTLDFAGFFGIFVEYVPLGADVGRSHVPVLFNPENRVHERLKADERANRRVRDRRRNRLALFKAWKGFKLSASSTFSFVKAVGLMYAPKLVSDSFGWSRPVPDLAIHGLDKREVDRFAPDIGSHAHCCGHGAEQGIPESEWLDHAERILRAMSMTGTFARLVLLAGHGSSSVN